MVDGRHLLSQMAPHPQPHTTTPPSARCCLSSECSSLPSPSLAPPLIQPLSVLMTHSLWCHYRQLKVAFSRVPTEIDGLENGDGTPTSQVEQRKWSTLSWALFSRVCGWPPVPLLSPRLVPFLHLLSAITLLFFLLHWLVGSAVQHRDGGLTAPPTPPHSMSQSSFYVRCDLLPNVPPPPG